MQWQFHMEKYNNNTAAAAAAPAAAPHHDRKYSLCVGCRLRGIFVVCVCVCVCVCEKESNGKMQATRSPSPGDRLACGSRDCGVYRRVA